MAQAELPKYHVDRLSYFEDLGHVGPETQTPFGMGVIAYLGLPGSNLTPLNDAAHEMKAKAELARADKQAMLRQRDVMGQMAQDFLTRGSGAVGMPQAMGKTALQADFQAVVAPTDQSDEIAALRQQLADSEEANRVLAAKSAEKPTKPDKP